MTRRYLLASTAIHAVAVFLLLFTFHRSGPDLLLIDGFDYLGNGGGGGKGTGSAPKAEQIGQPVPNPVNVPVPKKAAPVKEAARAEDAWKVKDAKVKEPPKKETKTEIPPDAQLADKEQKATTNIIRRGGDATKTGKGEFDFGGGEGGSGGGEGGGKGVGIGIGAGDGSGFGFGSYLSIMRRRIWEEWNQVAVMGTNYSCVVALSVSKQGDISGVTLEKPSGNSFYDSVAMRAVRNATPLPPLPSGVDSQRFRIQFRLLE